MIYKMLENLKKLIFFIGKKILYYDYSWIKSLILESRSIFIFYILFFIIPFVSINSIFSLIFSIVFIGIFFIRIYNRNNKLKTLQYFYLNETGYKTDSIKRSEQLTDIVAIIIYILYIIMSNGGMRIKFINSFLEIVVTCSLFYFISASLSISKNSKILKVITILLSTIQGLMLVLITIITILSAALNFINHIDGNLAFEPINWLFNNELIFIMSYLTQNLLIEMILIMAISIILLFIFIIETPPYQIQELATAFKIVNLIMVLLGIIIYVYSNMYWDPINDFIKSMSLEVEMYSIKYELPQSEIISIIEGFSKVTITNIGYVLFLPYTFGTLISNLYIESLKRKYKKRALESLDYILYMNENNMDFKYLLEDHEKRYMYYGGDKYLLKVLNLSVKNNN